MNLLINGEIWRNMDGEPMEFSKASQTETTYTLNGESFYKVDGYTYELAGGEWTLPEPTAEEVLRADVDYLLMLAEE